MDTMGDADELYEHDDVPRPRRPLVTTEGLAVTSLTTAVASLLVSFISQFMTFLLGDTLGLNDADESQRKQFALVMTPVAIMAFTAALCGVLAMKRRPENRWVGALALAGATVGVMIFLLVAAGVVAFLTTDPSPPNLDGF
jgi:hypothetical protein